MLILIPTGLTLEVVSELEKKSTLPTLVDIFITLTEVENRENIIARRIIAIGDLHEKTRTPLREEDDAYKLEDALIQRIWQRIIFITNQQNENINKLGAIQEWANSMEVMDKNP